MAQVSSDGYNPKVGKEIMNSFTGGVVPNWTKLASIRF